MRRTLVFINDSLREKPHVGDAAQILQLEETQPTCLCMFGFGFADLVSAGHQDTELFTQSSYEFVGGGGPGWKLWKLNTLDAA